MGANLLASLSELICELLLKRTAISFEDRNRLQFSRRESNRVNLDCNASMIMMAMLRKTQVAAADILS